MNYQNYVVYFSCGVLLMERLMCNSYKHISIGWAREWLSGDSGEFAKIIKQCEFVRNFIEGVSVSGDVSGWWSKSGQIGVRA